VEALRFGAVHALETAIAMNRVTIVRSLLNHLQTYIPRPRKWLHEHLLIEAITSNRVDCLKAVLAAAPNDQSRRAYAVSTRVFGHACCVEGGRPECVTALIVEA
jgi:hypothetical protein